MGIYVFNRKTLAQMLTEDAKRRDSSHDFGKDVLPRMVAGGSRVYAFPFQGYWVDVGTIEAYWQTQMDLLKNPPPLDLNDRAWIVHTRSEERPPVRIQEGAVVKDSMITDGCVIGAGARVESSILSPGVSVASKAVIRFSVILTDTSIESGARIERAVVDKQVRVGKNARIGQRLKDVADPTGGLAITTIGKSAQVPAGARVPRGAAVEADATPESFAKRGSRPDGRRRLSDDFRPTERRGGLPDEAAVSANHRFSRLAGEGRGELGNVRRRADGAETIERMRIRVGHQPLELRPAVGRPDARPVEEEALLGREAVDVRRPRLAFEALLEGLVRDRQAAQVRDRFAENELAVLVDVPLHGVARRTAFRRRWRAPGSS